MLALCIEPERREKTKPIMDALAAGGCGKVCLGQPSPWRPFVVWGHRWLAEVIVPRAMRERTEWWLIDNGWNMPAKGGATGYYSLTRCGTMPALIQGADRSRLPVEMKPWRRDGRHVLMAMPSPFHGRMMGLNMSSWRTKALSRVRTMTKRPIVIREKRCERPLADDLADAWVLVTHSSKAAVMAVRQGVPVIVHRYCAAAPVGGTDFAQLESPPTPDAREDWWASLMAQQFTLGEMRDGLAMRMMERVRGE